jgi:hypothetical protein
MQDEGGRDMKQKAGTKKANRGVKGLSAKTLTARQARDVKGGSLAKYWQTYRQGDHCRSVMTSHE